MQALERFMTQKIDIAEAEPAKETPAQDATWAWADSH